MPTAGITLAFAAAMLALYPAAAHQLWSMLLVITLIGAGGGLGAVLQARLSWTSPATARRSPPR